MSLLSSLSTTASALSAFDRALIVTSNNVSNSQTPGYATEIQNLSGQPFNPAEGLDGGVTVGNVESTRNEFAEQAVDSAQTSLGMATQQSSSLTDVQNALNLSAANGIPASLGNLFSSFSAWSEDPESESTRQDVMTSAQRSRVSRPRFPVSSRSSKTPKTRSVRPSIRSTPTPSNCRPTTPRSPAGTAMMPLSTPQSIARSRTSPNS